MDCKFCECLRRRLCFDFTDKDGVHATNEQQAKIASIWPLCIGLIVRILPIQTSIGAIELIVN